jgi:hypothetical protein
MIMQVNNRLISDTINRMYQDGYTLSTRAWEIGQDYQTQITRLINSGIAQGKSVAEIAGSIGEYTSGGIEALGSEYAGAKWGNVVVKNVDWRALRLVRSELGASMKIGAVMQGEMNPASTGLYDWVRVNNQQHDCTCPDLAAGGPYAAANIPAQPHANCHPSGTMIMTPYGEMPIELLVPGDFVISHDGTIQKISHCWKTRHSGELLELSTIDRKIQATNEHPFLIGNDWVLAHDIKPGDNITGVGINVESFALVKFVSDNSPSKRFDESGFFIIKESFLGGSVPRTSIDLNGQLYILKGQIDTESSNDKIRDWIFSEHPQGIVHHALIGAPECSGVELRAFGLLFVRDDSSSGRSVGVSGIADSTVGITPVVSLGNSGDMKSVINQISSDRSSGYSKNFRDLINWEVLTAKQISKHCPVNVDFNTHNSAIVSVKSEYYNGYVYNLTVENTHTFIANGFASHNCFCQVRPVLKDLKEVIADIKRWNAGESVPSLDSWYAKFRGA